MSLPTIRSFPNPPTTNNTVTNYLASTTINDNEITYDISVPIVKNSVCTLSIMYIITNLDALLSHVRIERFILKYLTDVLQGGFEYKDVLLYPDSPDVNASGIAYRISDSNLIITIENRDNAINNRIKWVIDTTVTCCKMA